MIVNHSSIHIHDGDLDQLRGRWMNDCGSEQAVINLGGDVTLFLTPAGVVYLRDILIILDKYPEPFPLEQDDQDGL